MRTRTRLVIVAGMAVAIGLLAFWMSSAPRGPGTLGPDRPSVRPAETESGQPARSADLREEEPRPVPDQAATAFVAVRVVEAETGQAIPGARVGLWPDASDDLASVDDRLSLADTDESGLATLDVGVDGDAFVVRASAPGFVSLSRRLAAAEVEGDEANGDPVAMALERGGVLRGTVRDESGRPVPDVTVSATATSLPVLAPFQGLVAFDDRTQGRATTDGEGRFVIRGLDVRRRHQVGAYADGWLMTHDPVLVRPTPEPREDVSITVSVVRMFRIRLVDEATGDPVSRPHVTIAISDESALNRGTQRSDRVFAGSSWLRTRDPSDEPGVYTGLARYTDAARAPSRCKIVVSSPGHEPAWTTVTLRMPTELVEDGSADLLRLKRTDSGETGSLRVLEGWPSDVAPADWRLLRFRIPEGWGFRRGTRVAGDAWRFDGIPIGAREISVKNGIVWSDDTVATVDVDDVAEARVSFSDPTGFVVEPRDSRGRTIYGAKIVAIQEGGTQHRARDMDDEGRIVLVVEPGRPTVLLVSAPGYRTHRVEMALAEGECPSIRAVLEEQ